MLVKIVEWFFMLFLRKKATEVKKEAFLERQKAITDYSKIKKANDKYLSKYSGRKRYVKTGKAEVSRQITEIIELPIESEIPINDRLSSPFK